MNCRYISYTVGYNGYSVSLSHSQTSVLCENNWKRLQFSDLNKKRKSSIFGVRFLTNAKVLQLREIL